MAVMMRALTSINETVCPPSFVSADVLMSPLFTRCDSVVFSGDRGLPGHPPGPQRVQWSAARIRECGQVSCLQWLLLLCAVAFSECGGDAWLVTVTAARATTRAHGSRGPTPCSPPWC